jgi:hypothetical protein
MAAFIFSFKDWGSLLRIVLYYSTKYIKMKKIASIVFLLMLAGVHFLAAQNVGIGTATPAFKLDVEGNLRAKGNRVYIGIEGQFIASSSSTALYTNANWEPLSNNAFDLGTLSFRWETVFASNLNINQSIISNGQSGSTGIFLGNNVSGKELNAGRIGYSLFSTNTLDIVGAGNSPLSRRIKLWAEDAVEMTGGLIVNENARIDGSINVVGKIQRSSTGLTNLVPIAMASVNEFGTVVGSTGNVSVVKNMSAGLSEITIGGETITINGYIIQVTPVYTFTSDDIEDYAVSVRIADGKIRLYILRNSTASNSPYHLVVYKLG